MQLSKPIYTFDIETDPFYYQRDPLPFCAGLFDGKEFVSTWGNNCIPAIKEKLDKMNPGILYAHNGGKFDMYYCMDWFMNNQDMTIINNRIVRAAISREYTGDEPHEFRDSYAIIPFALKKYKKETVDYRTFEKKYRNKNKATIIAYLKQDCVSLYELCVSFWERFGDNLTIGSTSMKHLKRLHRFERLDVDEDKMIRIPYFYGGRVQCFESGIIKPSSKDAKIIAYDLNQCYPHVMRNMMHPISKPVKTVGNDVTDNTYFLTVYGRNNNAFPVRTANGLRFNVKKGIFSITIHEYKAAIETGLFECEDILECIDFEHVGSFAKFVDKYHKLRKEAQLNNDDIGALFYKYVCNSAYGKFAQNPDNYYDYKLLDMYTNPNGDKHPDEWLYHPCTEVTFAGCTLWRQSSLNDRRYNVATGASITGAARSLIIRAYAAAQRPLYCDTDSIVCEGLVDAPVDATKLGHWKIEATGNMFAVGGRKMYALFGTTCPTCKSTKDKPVGECRNIETRNNKFHMYGCIKDAHKGAELTPNQIVDVARGKTVTWYKDAPTYNLAKHTIGYMQRNIKLTTIDAMMEDD